MSSAIDSTFVQEAFLVNKKPIHTSIASEGLRRLVSLRKHASIPYMQAALRLPTGALGYTVDGIYYSLGLKGSEAKKETEQRKEILYVQMREVRT